MDEIKEILMYYTENGEKKHICPEFTRLVKEAQSISELVKLYKREPSWAMSVHYPAFDVMKKYFNTPDIREQEVFVDRSDSFTVCHQVAMFNKCKGTVLVSWELFRFPVLYVGLDSELTITVKSPYAEINVYDNSNVIIKTEGSGQCRVFLYGSGNVLTGNPQRVKIIDKREK